MENTVLVIGEERGGVLRNVSLEAIAAAKSIKKDSEIVGVLFGFTDLKNLAQEMIYYGADRIITITNEYLEDYTSDAYGQALMAVIEEEKPFGIVMGHTAAGKDLTPKIASILESGLISDVIKIEQKDNQIIYTRPIYSGKAYEKKIITAGIIFATIRPNNITRLVKDESRIGDIEEKKIEISSPRTIIKEVFCNTSNGLDMTESSVVVAGGRGVKSVAGFELLYELANVLEGTVGASRGACDADYCDYSLQIGQTGKVVTPDLYIAVGISGAIQHLAGISNSKVIIAVNNDPEANIFNVADYGIVGDLFEVIPMLIEEFKKINESSVSVK